MKSVTIILLLISICSLISYSQQAVDAKSVDSTDSLKIKIKYNPFVKMQTTFDEFELYREFNDIKMSVPIDGDPQTVWLRTSLAVSNMDYLSNNFSHHLLSFLEEQYLKNSRLNPLTYILGIVQTGAAGYLAYKHIKKYGFLK